jgi:major membrane immunogen (membrane-anchored lipoprotein)
MRVMNAELKTYPNKFTRYYASELIARQSTAGIDAMSGATLSFDSFVRLADAVIARAKTGDDKVVFVKTPGE